jgi:hypothetical protein
MLIVTEEKIEQLLRERLKEHGVLEQVDEIDLFLTPEGALAEVFLRDASVLEQAQQAVQVAERQLERERVSLLATVRALWKVDSLQKIETTSAPGVPSELLGSLFRANLRSGERIQEVWVAMTPSALRVLRPLAPNDEALANLARAFLLHRLSIGGAGYWDPIREQKVEVGEGEARYLRWRPFEQLKLRVHVVFRTLDSARRFLQGLDLKGSAPRDLNDVLHGLPGPGGAYVPGERLPTTDGELYEMLLESEKDEWWQFYLKELSQVGKKWPELKQEFPKAFVE